MVSGFYKLRSEILKKGTIQTNTSTHIRTFSFPRDLGKLGTPPPNARSFFMGDQSGGSGWEIELEDGSITKYYVELPKTIGEADVYLFNAPKSHLGKELSDTTIVNLSRLYMNYIRQLANAAVKRFGASAK